jgi:hypothetical protein
MEFWLERFDRFNRGAIVVGQFAGTLSASGIRFSTADNSIFTDYSAVNGYIRSMLRTPIPEFELALRRRRAAPQYFHSLAFRAL